MQTEEGEEEGIVPESARPEEQDRQHPPKRPNQEGRRLPLEVAVPADDPPVTVKDGTDIEDPDTDDTGSEGGSPGQDEIPPSTFDGPQPDGGLGIKAIAGEGEHCGGCDETVIGPDSNDGGDD